MAGIVFQQINGGLADVSIWLFVITAASIAFKFFQFKAKPIVFGILIYGFCFVAGKEVCRREIDILRADHFSEFKSADSYIGTVDDEVSVKPKSISAKIKIEYIHQSSGWKKAQGYVLSYFPASTQKWKYGDKLLISGSPQVVSPPSDPLAFNYAKYLSYKNIYHQHFIRKGEFALLTSEPHSKLWELAYSCREGLSGLLSSALGTGQEFAVASMVVLGIKQSIDQDLIDAYSSSGAMHVLAVSGLHVGMIFGLIQMLLGTMKRSFIWKHVFYFFALAVIWAFGLITAFSPSVLRAVVMFTIIIIGQWIGRKGNLYNTLGLTSFVILLFDPFMLMNVGFQMSFLAVFGIAYLHPKLFSLYKGKSRVLKWLWEVTSISLCAQLFTFPLALYYFNQFPTYFLLSNLWVIPLSSVILYVGIIFFIGAWWVPWKIIFGVVLKYSVWALNKSMYIVSFIPGAVTRTIYFDYWEIVLLYGLIISFLLLFYFRNKKWMYVGLSLSLLFVAMRLTKIKTLENVHKIMVGQIKGKAYITIWKSTRATVYLPRGTDENAFFVKTQILKPLETNGVINIEIKNIADSNLTLTYGLVKLQIVNQPKFKRVAENVNYICLQRDEPHPENYTENSQIKRVILCNNRSPINIKDLVWDIKAQGVFVLDI